MLWKVDAANVKLCQLDPSFQLRELPSCDWLGRGNDICCELDSFKRICATENHKSVKLSLHAAVDACSFGGTSICKAAGEVETVLSAGTRDGFPGSRESILLLRKFDHISRSSAAQPLVLPTSQDSKLVNGVSPGVSPICCFLNLNLFNLAWQPLYANFCATTSHIKHDFVSDTPQISGLLGNVCSKTMDILCQRISIPHTDTTPICYRAAIDP